MIAQQLVAAAEAGATKGTSVVCSEVATCGSSVPVFEAIAAEVGIETVETVPISSTVADYSSECVGFVQDELDFVQTSASTPAGINLMSNGIDQG